MATQSIQRLTVSEPFLRLGSLLAEGPFYRAEDDTLHFVDIQRKINMARTIVRSISS